MPTFNRNEQIAILALTALLIVGSVVSTIDYFWPAEIDDFEVRRSAIPVPVIDTSDSLAADGSGSVSSPTNLNTATAKQLMDLPQIGPKTAELIISYRESNGDFKSTDELIAIKGIGPRTLEKLRSRIVVGSK